MNKYQVAYSVLGAIGLILAAIGYLIKFKSMIHLVAGVCKNDQRIKDKQGFASFIGGNVLLLGVVFFVGALIIFNNPQYESAVETLLLLVIGSITFKNSKKYLIDEKE